MNFNKIFNSQTKTVTFAAILLSLSALISRILGLVRNGLLAGYFGTKSEANVYLAAFRIPDLIYNLLIVGGLAVAFLPIFSEHYSKNKEKAWEMTNYLLNVFLFFLILASLVLFIFTPWIVKIIVPGFSPQEKVLTALLTRIMFLSPIFFGLSSVFSGILHYFNRFLSYSLAPILYNLGIIAGILFFYPIFGLLGLAYGVILGAFCHWLIQIPSAKNCGFRYRFLFNFKHPDLRAIFRLMVPRVLAIAAQQINLLVITAIASTIIGGVAIFSYANDLYYFPVGLIGIPFALAAFPALSRDWSTGQKKKFIKSFSSIFRQILFLVIPISFLIFILRAQLVRLILGTLGPGEFGWSDTRLTAACLGIFSIGIFASALIPFISRAFFSFQNTKTPTLVAAIAFTLNIIWSLSFVWLLRFSNPFQAFLVNNLKLKGIEDISVTGLPLAFSLAAILQLILLLIFLYKEIGDFRLKEIWQSALKFLLTSLLMGLIAYSTLYIAANFVNMEKVFGVFSQTILAGFSGFLVYFGLAFFFKFPELSTIISSFKKQFRKEIIPPSEIEIT